MSIGWNPIRVKLLILGTGDFAQEVAYLTEQCPDLELAGFVENWRRERTAEPLLGLPVHWIDDAGALAVDHLAVCALGSTRRRAYVDAAAQAGFRFARVAHPSAVVAGNAEIEPGTIVGAGVIVGAHTRVGAHTILNRGALLGHHIRVGECVTVSPGANVAGRVMLADQAFIGMGAIIVEDTQVGEGAVVAAGSVVVRDVPAGVRVQGVPARVVGRTDPR